MYVLHSISFVNAINQDAEGFSALAGRQQLLIFMSAQEYPQHRKICCGNKWDTIWNISKGHYGSAFCSYQLQSKLIKPA
jgi:hypothetical protein